MGQDVIAVCQPFSRTARFHLSFDRSLLTAISAAVQEEEILYISDGENLARMQSVLVPTPRTCGFRPRAAPRMEPGGCS